MTYWDDFDDRYNWRPSEPISKKEREWRRFEEQVMPEGVVKDGLLVCPFAGCWKKQSRITIGIHECTNPGCGRRFKVPNRETFRRARANVKR